MSAATRELLASRAEVWSFLAEPYHLSDWWPGIVSVEPDRRGFSVGARWRVSVISDPPRIGNLLRFPRMGRPAGPAGVQTLVITAIEPLERWSWQLVGRAPLGRERAVATRSADIELRSLAEDRAEVAVTVAIGSRDDPQLARAAANRLYDLVQTAASL